jgi:chemotaxis protein MotB
MARVKIQEDAPTGCPDYMLTYGDLMGQLLCFFIILVSMSTVKEEKFQKLMDSVRQAFGYDLGMEVTPGTNQHTMGIFENLQFYYTPRGVKGVQGGSEVINVRGREFLCRSVRDGRLISVGDRVGFEPGSAELSAAMKEDLDALMGLIKDYANRLLVCAHVSAQEVPEGATDWQLSFLRAKAVGDYLEAKGINPKRLRLSACGSVDPIDSNLTPEGRAHNRRVEIVVSEELVQDLVPRRTSHE